MLTMRRRRLTYVGRDLEGRSEASEAFPLYLVLNMRSASPVLVKAYDDLCIKDVKEVVEL